MSHRLDAPRVDLPQRLVGAYDIHRPRHLMVVGETAEADMIESTKDLINDIGMWGYDMSAQTTGTDMLVLTLPYGKGKDDIRRDHPNNLTNGIGLQKGQGNETLFIGPRQRAISTESAIWIGRALCTPHLERVYFLDQSRGRKVSTKIAGLGAVLTVIDNPIDVIRLVNKHDSTEIGYSRVGEIESTLAEAIS